MKGFLSIANRYERNNSKLGPAKIMQIVWHWLIKTRPTKTSQLIGVNEKTTFDWYNYCREVCETINANHWRDHKLGDGIGRINGETPNTVVQGDEALMRGRAMYHRGRQLLGDRGPNANERREFADMNQGAIGPEMNPQRNFGRRIEGPWIFGMVECNRDNNKYVSGEVRAWYVQNRRAETLIPLWVDNVSPNSSIWTDEWAAYNQLDANFQHQTVNHQQQFVNGDVHTQNIEREWSTMRKDMIRDARGYSRELIETYLAEFCWRSRNRNISIYQMFLNFIADASSCYPIDWN